MASEEQMACIIVSGSAVTLVLMVLAMFSATKPWFQANYRILGWV